jgi:hypothetical protein
MLYSGSGNSQLIALDTVTGLGSVIGPFGAEGVFAGAFSPAGTFYTVINTYSSGTALATVDLTTGHATPYAPVANKGIDMLQFDHAGTLYASEGASLYRMDVGTGALTNIGGFGPGVGSMMDLAVDSHGTMYGVASGTLGGNSQFYSINTATGAATLLFAVSEPCIMGLAFDSADKLYGTNYCTGNSPLYSIDLAGHSISMVGMSGVGNLHGGDIAPVPEPGSIALTGIALGFAALAGRRRAHNCPR